MTKTYNTPKRTHIVKTRLDDEEHAEFLRRMELYEMSQPCRNPKIVWLNWTDCSSVFMRIWSTENCPKLVFRCCLMIMSRSRQT